jgi:hypothetical protein
MDIVGMILSADNLHTLVLLVAGIAGFLWLKRSLKDELNADMDRKLDSFYHLIKTNDFAHLNQTIETLTFTLEKNKFLTTDDKAFVDSRLDK